MEYSVDPDQMLHSAASNLGVHCLQRLICPDIFRVITGILDIFVVFVLVIYHWNCLREAIPVRTNKICFGANIMKNVF